MNDLTRSFLKDPSYECTTLQRTRRSLLRSTRQGNPPYINVTLHKLNWPAQDLALMGVLMQEQWVPSDTTPAYMG
jgi:hypothetical protein